MRTTITVDTDTIRRLHSIAKELDSLANSLRRPERRRNVRAGVGSCPHDE